jgi:diguanylate cyclase (GGDEF)-like protein
MAQQLSWQASHDALTGLVNRREFENRLRKALEGVARDKHPHALLYVDLDQFKVVNDTCGHVAGDELLRQVSMLLRDRIRESDTLARLGGDEFGVLLTACPQRIAEDIASKLLGTVKEFRFVWQDRTFEIGASIGLAVVADPDESMDSLMSAADMACYAAKDLGRNRVHVYNANDADLSQRHDEMQLVSRITNALDEGRFALYRQKIVPLGERDNGAQHYEILLRMVDEDGQLVPPGAFMPAAERYNLMPTIDRWVIRTFLSEFREDLRRLASDCRTSTPGMSCFYTINLSGASLADDNFLEFIEGELAAHGIPPNVIAFEVTETVAIANLARAVTFMRELRARGCLFALDDFGSGVSSFAYLKNLPVQFLKIDGSFVKDMTDDPIDRAMVSSINEIGHVMGVRTIAEFVEDAETFRELERLGVDFAQGFGIERPQPLYEPPSVASTARVANASPYSKDEQQPGPQDDTVEYERPHPDAIEQLKK